RAARSRACPPAARRRSTRRSPATPARRRGSAARGGRETDCRPGGRRRRAGKRRARRCPPPAPGSACRFWCRASATSSRPLLARLVGARAPLLGTDPLLHRMDPPAVVVLPFRPEVAQLRHDLVGEELGRVARLPVRHVAVVHETEEMADVKALDAL